MHELLLEDQAKLHVKNSHGMTVMDYAVSNKQVKVVDVLFAHGTDLNALNSSGYNILHRCVLSEQLDKVELCVEMGSCIDCRTGNNETALILATKNGLADIVKYVVSVVCDISIKDNVGFDALEYAFFSDNSDIQQILKHAPGNHNWPETESGRRLIFASKNGYVDSVKAIIAHFGEEIIHFKDPDETYATAFQVSCMNGHLSIAQFLLQTGANIHDRAVDGDTALIMAANAGHMHVVHWLIQKGSLINYYSSNNSALIAAIQNDHRDIVKMLFQGGAMLNTVYQDDNEPESFYSAVHIAAGLKSNYLIRYLIQQGAYGNNCSSLVGSPFGIAASSGTIECLKYFVEQNWDINKREKQGFTPLMHASYRGHLETVKYLVQHGADVNLIIDDRRTALDMAIDENHIDIINFLMDKMDILNNVQNSNNDLSTSSNQQSSEEKLLVQCEKGCESQDEFINLQTEDGKTPLITAVIHHKRNYVTWLLQNEADTNKQDLSGMTPLLYATELGYADMAELLLDNNANISIKDRNGRDAIAIASSQQDQRILDLIESHSGLRKPIQSKEMELLRAVRAMNYEQYIELLNNNVNANFAVDAIQILLKHGTLTENDVPSTMLFACFSSNSEIMDIMLMHFEKFGTKQISHYLKLGLTLAVTNDQIDMVEYFHKKVLNSLYCIPVLVQIAQAALKLVPENYHSIFSATQEEDYPLIVKMIADIPVRIRDKIRNMIGGSRKNFSTDDTEIGLWLALTYGHYEAVLALTPKNHIVIWVRVRLDLLCFRIKFTLMS